MSQGLNKEFIFNQEIFKSKYLFLLNHYKENFNLTLIAYCIMDNHVHLLLYSTSVQEISKFMRIVNTQFAQYYNFKNDRVGYVFRDRFLSEFIKDERQLWTCIKYIHMNPVKAGICKNEIDYKYSSYRDYFYSNGIVPKEILNFIFGTSDYLSNFINLNYSDNFLDFDKTYADTNFTNLNISFENYLKIKNISKKQLISDLDLLYNFCFEFTQNKNYSQRSLSKILGISHTAVSKILKK